MNFENTQNIFLNLKKNLTVAIELDGTESMQPSIKVLPEDLITICNFLFTHPEHLFDLLNCITAIDNHPNSDTIDLMYHLSSIPFRNSLILKTTMAREISDSYSINSLSDIWKTADWHEREIFDLFGVKFNNHPDLRRILLPTDWQGHPLRKDYQEQEIYHGIKVKY